MSARKVQQAAEAVTARLSREAALEANAGKVRPRVSALSRTELRTASERGTAARSVIHEAFKNYSALEFVMKGVSNVPAGTAELAKLVCEYNFIKVQDAGFALVAEDEEVIGSLIATVQPRLSTNPLVRKLEKLGSSSWIVTRLFFRSGIPSIVGMKAEPGMGPVKRMDRLGAAIEGSMDELMMGASYLYVMQVAVPPMAQGKGIGALLLKNFCETADELNLDSYLETNSELLVKFYEKYGFKYVRTVEVQFEPGDSLTTYCMIRKKPTTSD